MRLVAEWLKAERGAYWFQQRVRLGDLPADSVARGLSEAEQRLVRSAVARWADAIVELPDRTELIEAKIVAHPTAIGQLDLYAELLPKTPSLSHRAALPVTKILLYAIPDEAVIRQARARAIVPVEFRPPWVAEYLSRRAMRHRRAPRDQIATAEAS